MRRLTVVFVLMAALLAPSVASADDSSVYGAYISRDADFKKLGKQVRHGIRAWKASHYQSPKEALDALQETHQALGELAAAVAVEKSSSKDGKHARVEALLSIKALDRSVVAVSDGVRARTDGHRKQAKRLARRANRQVGLSLVFEKKARKDFKAAGVQIKH